MIEALWTFLTSPENHEVLSWIGGGVAVGGAGLWTVLRSPGEKRDKPNVPVSPAAEAAPDVIADRGGQSAGRDNYRNSGNSTTVSNGLSGWHLVAVMAVLAGAGLLAASQIGSRVTADGGSIAVGGNVSGSTISIGQ
jgi:hypothetical protein